MVYSADETPRAEALAPQKRLAALLSSKLKREYYEMCVFVKARMSLAIVIYISLLLCNPWYKGSRIQQQQELMDEEVIELIPPWHG